MSFKELKKNHYEGVKLAIEIRRGSDYEDPSYLDLGLDLKQVIIYSLLYIWCFSHFILNRAFHYGLLCA